MTENGDGNIKNQTKLKYKNKSPDEYLNPGMDNRNVPLPGVMPLTLVRIEYSM